MYLTPKEMERLTIFTAAEIARRRYAQHGCADRRLNDE